MPESAEELCLGVGREAHGQGEEDGEHVHHPHDDCGRSIDRSIYGTIHGDVRGNTDLRWKTAAPPPLFHPSLLGRNVARR